MTSRSVQSTDDNYPDDRIAALLERHGNAIRNNQPLRMEDLLLEVQPEYRSEFLIELLMQELELRQPPPVRDQARREFRDRFPDYLSAVSAALRQWRPEPAPADTVPVWIGKYKVIELLGTGSFATVYLADNPGLNRKVALKVPLTRPPEHDLDPDFDEAAREREEKRYKRELELFRKKMDQYRREARLLAEMDDPALVRIYDIFDSEHEVPILVQEFVEGPDLRQYLKQRYREPGRHVPIPEAIQLIMAICEGLAVAHQKEIYHRDLKPANILLDKDGKPKIADFGLALHASQLHSRANLVEGTLAYMAPEQIDGQTPRIDGRSDLWAVGVMLYEMVAGQHPFRWEYSSSREILRDRIRQSILESDPTPLHQLREDVPEELDRICRRCLQPQKDKRFDSIRRLSEDLAALAAQISGNSGRPPVSMAPPSAPAPGDASSGSTSPGSSTAAEPPQLRQPLKVSPRGLLSFTGAEQAEFLQLLPGVPDRHGLPPAVAFWKNRIEAGGLVRPFAVGLLYGPSGCGKTSLMRAGILPRLSPNVRAHYVEATAADTEVRILKDLRTTWKDLPQVDLPEMLRRIREQGQWLPLGHRLLVVVDQFEQWLHANHSFPQQQLTSALAQCDGARVQVILMIREEFIPLAEQFFSQLSIPLDANHNRFRLDLFDQSHARRVLTLFGVAQGHLPENASANTKAQNQFLKEAIKQLSSERGEVISVHLALFVEMFGNREWTPERLREVGGVERLGVRFLEDSFRREENRRYSSVAQRLLQSLLPQEGSSDTDETPRIKGAMRSRKQLQQAAGMEHQGDEFDRLMDKLEKTLRLITPTTPDGITATPAAAQADRYYQLTHDYLVPAVTDWIKQKQRETRSGQAELKLAERTTAWQRKKERRQLPSLQEWIQIRWHVPRRRWTEMQGRMMQAAAWLHLVRGGIALLLLMAVFVGTAWLQRQAAQQRAEALAGSFAQQKTSELAASLVPLQLLREYALPTLQKLYAESAKDSEARLHLAIARLQLGDQDVELLPAALELSLDCRPEQLQPLTTLLQPWAPQLQPKLRQLLEQPNTQSVTRRLHCACLLAAWEPGDGGNADTAWSQPETATFVAEQLAATNPVFVGTYQEVLRPQAAQLKQSLAKLFADPQQNEVTRTVVTGLLADYAKDDVQILTDVILEADPAADKILFPLLQPHRDQAIQQLYAILDRRVSPEWPDPPLDPAWTTPGPAVRAQLEAAHGVLADRYAFCLNLPLSELFSLVETLRSSGYRPTRLRPVVGSATDSPRMSAVWVRDGGTFAVRPGLRQEELPQPDVNAIHDGLLLADVAYVSGTGPQSGWLTLWDEPTAAGEERRCVISVSDQQLSSAQTQLTEQKFAAQTVLTVHNDARGQRLYSGIFSNTGPSSDTLLAWPGFERLDSPQRDVSGGEPGRAALPDPRATYRAQLLQLQTRSEEELQQPQTRFNRARALFQTDQAELAIVELDWLAENLSTPNASVLQFRTLTLAQLGRTEDAVAAFNAFQQTKPNASFVDYVAIQLTAWRKDSVAVRTAIDTATTTHRQNPADLYNIACAAALAGRAFRRQTAADEAAEFSARALQLLRQAIDGGYADLQNLLNDVDFADLHDHPEFVALIARLQPQDRFAGLWFADPALESRLLQAATPELLMQEVQGLLAENWRPVSVVSDSTNQQVSAVLLLQRRLIPEPDSAALANQQAAAATALLRLNAADRVWPLLQDSPDPTVRSLIQQRLPRYGVDAGTLLQQLQNETDVGRRRMLILGLGELAKAELIPESQRESLVQELVKRCADDPDPGVHGAAEWTLRQLRAESQIAEIRAAFGTGTAVGDRRWYITKTRGDTKDSSGLSMAILDGRREFLMGSPLSEVERYGGADGRPNFELLHRRRIGRVYAIGMHEVTVAQFRAFRANHAFDRGDAKSDDAPANVITWYDAAAFCNWLSEQEGLSREQWCYDPEQQFSSGMQLKANFLELEGYRLPTESEWESAARGGTLTSRFFGSDRGLLPNYAWYYDNSKEQGMLPVGSLRPNPFGLFELYGNAAEWCHDEAEYFRSDRPFLADGPNSGAGGEVVDTSSRVLRGGSFYDSASGLRSADRTNDRPDYRVSTDGFRVSRTYLLPP